MINLPPFEVLLPLGAAAFYLYDCCLLLFAEEVIWVWTGAAWVRTLPTDVVIARRRLWVLNPLRPDRAAYRGSGDTLPSAPVAALRPLQGMVWLLLALLALALPIVSVGLGAGLALLLVFGLFYAAVALLLTLIWRRRAALGLTTRAYLALAADCLLCPPFAINVVRRISLRTA